MQASPNFNILEIMTRGSLLCTPVPERDEHLIDITLDSNHEAFK
jgi:hypothetical protein